LQSRQNRLTLILWIFISAAAIQLFYWAIIFGRLAFYREKKGRDNTVQIPVSVIICARNEAENLSKNLPFMLQQQYKEFEVIVADDASSDRTAETVSALQLSHPKLVYIKLENKNSLGKRAILTSAVNSAKYDWLLLTDADCRPIGENWIGSMTQKTSKPSIEIVLGYGPYLSEKGLLNSWIRFETILTATQYFSAAIWGIPYMGVGRNLLIKKSLWLKNLSALEKNADLISGDDDLMVNAAANKKNTAICLDEESFAYSEPKQTLKALITQKSRHYSAGTRYKNIHKIWLTAFSFSTILFGISFFCLLCYYPIPLIMVFLARMLIFLSVNIKILHTFREKIPVHKLLFFDFILAFYYIFFTSTLIIKNRNKWS
jgi:biofilm PGA synthesis N-glycosyltransferase PgaC